MPELRFAYTVLYACTSIFYNIRNVLCRRWQFCLNFRVLIYAFLWKKGKSHKSLTIIAFCRKKGSFSIHSTKKCKSLSLLQRKKFNTVIYTLQMLHLLSTHSFLDAASQTLIIINYAPNDFLITQPYKPLKIWIPAVPS